MTKQVWVFTSFHIVWSVAFNKARCWTSEVYEQRWTEQTLLIQSDSSKIQTRLITCRQVLYHCRHFVPASTYIISGNQSDQQQHHLVKNHLGCHTRVSGRRRKIFLAKVFQRIRAIEDVVEPVLKRTLLKLFFVPFLTEKSVRSFKFLKQETFLCYLKSIMIYLITLSLNTHISTFTDSDPKVCANLCQGPFSPHNN